MLEGPLNHQQSQSRKSNAAPGRGAKRVFGRGPWGGACVSARGPVVELYFPPLRAGVSALMLALFGCACGIIAGAAISGLLHAGDTHQARLLALAFAGVFALPLAALGLWFMVCAVWAAANSLTVEISNSGLRNQRRCFGCAFAPRELRREDITALDAALAARYLGIFSNVRFYRLLARGRTQTLVIADTLHGPEAVAELRTMVMEQLQMPELAATNNTVP